MKTKRCVIEGKHFQFNKRMSCDHQGCSIEDFPEERFNWLETNRLHGIKCSFHKASIMAKDEVSKLYYNEQCNVKDFHCDLGDSILVWNNSVINSCPFNKIKGIKGRFTYEDNLFLFNNESNIVLQPVKKIYLCNMTMYETYQGIHVTFSTHKELEVL